MLFKMLQKTRYLTFAVLVFFLAGEFMLRVFFSENLVRHEYPKIYAFDPVVGYKGIPHVEGHIRRPSIDKHFKLNNLGFCGPDFQAEHPDSIFRIGVFGASRVEGVWANQIESFPGLLNNLFREKGYRVEVINLGVSGASRDLQNIALVKELASRFTLNMALLEGSFPVSSIPYYRDRYKGYSILFTGNDSLESEKSRRVAEKKVDLLKMHKLYTDLWDASYFVRFFVKRSQAGWGTVGDCLKHYSENICDSWQYYSMIQYDTAKSIGILNDLQLHLDECKTKLVLFGYTADPLWKGMENSNDINFSSCILNIDLNQEKYAHPLDGHPNLLAGQVIGEHLFNGLIKYIPEQFRPQKNNFLLKYAKH